MFPAIAGVRLGGSLVVFDSAAKAAHCERQAVERAAGVEEGIAPRYSRSSDFCCFQRAFRNLVHSIRAINARVLRRTERERVGIAL